MNIDPMHINIRPLREADLPEADRIFRLAFGTFLGLPEPLAFAGDADYVNTRWRASPDAALGAYADDLLVGATDHGRAVEHRGVAQQPSRSARGRHGGR